MCKYIIAWVGECKNEADESGFCEEHKKARCSSCGEQATHSCEETSFLVCGSDLCDNCEHTICENGCNSGAPRPIGLKSHCKKGQQVYKPWYMRENENDKFFIDLNF